VHTLERTSGSNHGGVLIKSTTSLLIAGDITVPDKVWEDRAGLPSSFHCTFPINPQVRLLLGFNQASVFWSWRESMLKQQRRERELKEWLQSVPLLSFYWIGPCMFSVLLRTSKTSSLFSFRFCPTNHPSNFSKNWTHGLGVASPLHLLCWLSCYKNTNLWDYVSSTFYLLH